jgi:hypothetical protein
MALSSYSTCQDNADQPTVLKQHDHSKIGAYRHCNSVTTLCDLLWVLPYCIADSVGIAAMTDLMRAYAHGGTIIDLRSREGPPKRIYTLEIPFAPTWSVTASAKNPRNYVIAMMPAFPWYTYSKQCAPDMTF